MAYLAGVLTGAQYAFEDPDGWNLAVGSHTGSDETYVAFGQGVDATFTGANNKERIFGIGARNATDTVSKQFAGSITVNGTLTNVYWLLGVLGANADAGTGPSSWTHTYTQANKLPSATIQAVYELGTTDQWIQFVGCISKTSKFNMSINEAVKFTLEYDYRYTTRTEATVAAVQDSFTPFVFSEGTIELPNATAVAAIQTCELTIVNNVEFIYGIGNRFATGFVAKNREYNFTITAAISSHVLLSRFYDGTSTGTVPHATSFGDIASFEITLTKGTESIVMLFGSTHIDTHDIPLSANEVVKATVNGWCESCTSVIYTNSVQIAPIEANNIV